MGGVFEAAALQRHQALIAAHVRPLVDGHRQMPLAEQRAGILPVLQPGGVEAGIGAQPVGRLKIHHHERDRAIGLGLQDEAAVELQRRPEQGREHDRLAQQLADGGRIIVPGQDVVERRPEPREAAAQIEFGDLERQHRVIDRDRGRGTNGAGGGDFGVGGFSCHGGLSGVGVRETKGA